MYVSKLDDGVVKQTLTPAGYSPSLVVSMAYADGIVVDASGNVFISNDSGQLLEETLSNGEYSQSTIAQVSGPLAIDGNGNLYVAKGDLIKETLSSGVYTQSQLNAPGADTTNVAVDARGNVFVMNLVTSTISSVGELDVADPPSLSLATTGVGSTSSDSRQTVTLINSGNAVLSCPAPASGNNPAIAFNFALDSSADWACPVTGAGASSAGTLAVGASCSLSVSFAPGVVGSLSGSLVLTHNALNAAAPNYATQAIALSGTATSGTPLITWAAPAISYGAALSAIQLDATASVAGTFTYSPTAGTVLSAGSQTLSINFTPTDTIHYTPATASTTLIVNQATPAITWTAPAAISYGTVLSAAQLDATASIAGTFCYTPAAGTQPGLGLQTLTAIFTPADAIDYASATVTTTLSVNQAKAAITWAAPAAISYGTNLSAILNATAHSGSTAIPGSFAYTAINQAGATSVITAASILDAGTYTLNTVYTPTNTVDYTTASGRVSLTVNQATPSIALTANAAFAFLSSSVSFTATLASPAPSLTGTVAFFDGTTPLGSGSIANNAAIYATSSLAAGPHSITAVYSGDLDLSAVTSTALAQTIQDFTIAVASTGSSSATASPGGQASYPLVLTPLDGVTLPGAVSLAVTGLPTGATSTFSTSTVAAGAGTTDVMLTVSLPSQAAAIPVDSPLQKKGLPVAFALVLLPFVTRLRRLLRSDKASATVSLVLLGLAGACWGCRPGRPNCWWRWKPIQPDGHSNSANLYPGHRSECWFALPHNHSERNGQ